MGFDLKWGFEISLAPTDKKLFSMNWNKAAASRIKLSYEIIANWKANCKSMLNSFQIEERGEKKEKILTVLGIKLNLYISTRDAFAIYNFLSNEIL